MAEDKTAYAYKSKTAFPPIRSLNDQGKLTTVQSLHGVPVIVSVPGGCSQLMDDVLCEDYLLRMVAVFYVLCPRVVPTAPECSRVQPAYAFRNH